jgi:ATPase family associated with various cellular activities (AAA)
MLFAVQCSLISYALRTGKTIVACAISDMLFGLSLIPTNKFVEKSALDLTADYVGQTTTKVQDALKEASVQLGQGPFGKEACDTLVAAMTSEEF